MSFTSSKFSFIGYIIIAFVSAITNEDMTQTITRCYNDIAETMSDSDGDCAAEMADIDQLLDDTFAACLYFSANQTSTLCLTGDEWLGILTDATNGYCNAYDAAIYYLDFKETHPESLDPYQIVEADEYTKEKNSNCVWVYKEEITVHYDSIGKIHTIEHNNHPWEGESCMDWYISDQDLEEDDLSEDGFRKVTDVIDIDVVRAGLIALDDEIRALRPNVKQIKSPELIEAYMRSSSEFRCKVKYESESSFIYIQIEMN